MPAHLACDVILFTRQPLEAGDSHIVDQRGDPKSQLELTFNKRGSGAVAESLRIPELSDWRLGLSLATTFPITAWLHLGRFQKRGPSGWRWTPLKYVPRDGRKMEKVSS